MSVFIAINNARDVWDYKSWKSAGYPNPCWLLDDDDYKAAKAGDRVIHYVTSHTPREQGFHMLMTILSKSHSSVSPKYWRSRAPIGPVDHAILRIDVYRRVSRTTILSVMPDFTKRMMGCQGRNSKQVSAADGISLLGLF